MNIIEAIKSGAPIRRKRWNFWLDPNQKLTLFPNDLMSEDWEVKEGQTIEVTKEQMREILIAANMAHPAVFDVDSFMKRFYL